MAGTRRNAAKGVADAAKATRSVAGSIVVGVMTALVALILGAVQTLTTAVTVAIGLTATTAVIVPGTGTPHPQDVTIYIENASQSIPGQRR